MLDPYLRIHTIRMITIHICSYCFLAALTLQLLIQSILKLCSLFCSLTSSSFLIKSVRRKQWRIGLSAYSGVHTSTSSMKLVWFVSSVWFTRQAAANFDRAERMVRSIAGSFHLSPLRSTALCRYFSCRGACSTRPPPRSPCPSDRCPSSLPREPSRRLATGSKCTENKKGEKTHSN